MLTKCMNLLKIGSASIDLVLHKTEFEPGANVKGCFYLKGGWVKQKIKRLECDLIVKNSETNQETMVEAATTILMSKIIDSHSMCEFPFSYKLPTDLHHSEFLSYRFHTRLIFTNEIKQNDHDEIKIVR